MIFIGKHGEDCVYEPINTWLQSPEEGLRYHRTMDVNDVYDGCLDMATFGRPVVGPISEDNKWLVNPLVCDPTRPLPWTAQTGKIRENLHQSLATPLHEPRALGDHTRVSFATDVDIGLMAELGAAIKRGASEARARSQDSTSAAPHAAQPVPSTSPPTPESASLPSPSPLATWTPTLSTTGYLAEAGMKIAVTSLTADAGAIGGASAGELLGGDLAVSNIGPIAEPLGQAVGRNIGRIVGGAVGAAAIRYPSLSRSTRSPSVVRFSPDVQVRPQSVISRSSQYCEIHASAPSVSATTSTDDLIVSMRADSTAKFNKLFTMMSQMASMLSTSQQESRYREDAIRGEIKTAIVTSTKDNSIVTAQAFSLICAALVVAEQ